MSWVLGLHAFVHLNIWVVILRIDNLEYHVFTLSFLFIRPHAFMQKLEIGSDYYLDSMLWLWINKIISYVEYNA